MKLITLSEAWDLIKKTNGQIFSAEFIKKSDGTYRKIKCRLGVKKGVNGKGMHYNPFEKGLIPVYELDHKNHEAGDKHFRMITVPNLLGLVIDHQTFVVHE